MNTTASKTIGGRTATSESLADLTKWSVCISSEQVERFECYTLTEVDTKEQAWECWKQELAKDIQFATVIRENIYKYEHDGGIYAVEIIAPD